MTHTRHYFIDWLRVIAIGLLLIYHIAIGFQPWGIMIAFITNEKPWTGLWIPMSMLNVWRIPLLFFVSGMGVYFAMQKRSWKELLKERTFRIWLPFVFGMFAIVPVHLLLWKYYYKLELKYEFDPGHLWFLANIFCYVVFLTPLLFYLKRHENGLIVSTLKKLLSNPLGLLIVAAAFIAEVMIIKPMPYELYAMTWHGFFLGILAFFFGFLFVLIGSPFWHMLQTWRWLFLVLATGLFVMRIYYFGLSTPAYLLVTESQAWIFSAFAFGSLYLNKSGCVLTYLSQAIFPVYILHMIFLYLSSFFVFQLPFAAPIQFLLVLAFTLCGCFLSYEVIRRVPVLRLLFGLRLESTDLNLTELTGQSKLPPAL